MSNGVDLTPEPDMIALVLGALALAAPADRPFTLAAGIATGVGAPSVGAAGSLRAMAHLGAFGVEGVIREGVYSAEARTVGALSLSGRWRATRVLAVRAGFVHHHEVPLDVLADQPLAAVFGSAEGIVHRSGLEGAVSLDLPLGWGDQDRWGLLVEVGASGFPEAGHHGDAPRGPAVYGWIEGGITFDVGRRRSVSAG